MESFNNMAKHGYLPSMKNKSVFELVRVLVTEMIPSMEARYKLDQYCASDHWRKLPTFDLPDALNLLPYNILQQIRQERTKSHMIDDADITQ